MMSVRELDQAPRILPLYARAAAPLLPGASLLPFVPGAGTDIPTLELLLDDERSDPERLSAYSRVCGFTLRNELPGTYPHVLAFPLQMALMADHSFPFGAVGLVHIANRIVQHRPIDLEEGLRLRVWGTPLEPHPRGRTFSILTEGHVGEELVWEERSTMLRRGPDGRGDAPEDSSQPSEGGGPQSPKGDATRARGTTFSENTNHLGRPSAEWHLAGDLGRRYGSVSGDRNPIHMHALTAKLLGFPRAIAHGMWSKARCLAAFEGRLPAAFSIQVSYRKPILLPGKVSFEEEIEANGWRLQLRDARSDTVHLEGTISSQVSVG